MSVVETLVNFVCPVAKGMKGRATSFVNMEEFSNEKPMTHVWKRLHWGLFNFFFEQSIPECLLLLLKVHYMCKWPCTDFRASVGSFIQPSFLVTIFISDRPSCFLVFKKTNWNKIKHFFFLEEVNMFVQDKLFLLLFCKGKISPISLLLSLSA